MTPWDVIPYVAALAGLGMAIGPLSRPLGALFRYPHVLLLPFIQLLAGCRAYSGTALAARPSGCCCRHGSDMWGLARVPLYMRQQLGLDGADQMLTIVLLGFGALLGNTVAGSAAVDYAALQLLLSYAVSGTAKAVSTQWRSGRAIVEI